MPKQSQESSRKCGHFLVALAELAAVYGLGRVVDSRVWFNSIQAHSFTGYLPVFSSGNGLKGTFFFSSPQQRLTSKALLPRQRYILPSL